MLISQFNENSEINITPTTELIDSGIVDSMNIAELLAYIEGATGQAVEVSDLDLADLATPQTIAAKFLSEGTLG
ncbi:phosphopantetheine-binding protein [Rhodovulum sp. FJ3]|uniref:phosphopantetheine-binding protein n=1 Tax=Rhodovulum sp. FJ3 TaxID=3079053 RepID=UPI00293DE67D|nr:phosphopantetheine-binding protein [Rhodovulum sp. FJ3]MDV4169587.1 phosphopantetheine-binding protein [Rhodovulum sp. FJ3]